MVPHELLHAEDSKKYQKKKLRSIIISGLLHHLEPLLCDQQRGKSWGRSSGRYLQYISMNCPSGAIFINIFFNILRGPITPHYTTGLEPRQNPRRLFPSRTVQPLLRRSRLRGRHQPTNNAEFEIIEIVFPPLLSILFLNLSNNICLILYI